MEIVKGPLEGAWCWLASVVFDVMPSAKSHSRQIFTGDYKSFVVEDKLLLFFKNKDLFPSAMWMKND